MANVKDSSFSASGFENKATRMVIAERLNSCARGIPQSQNSVNERPVTSLKLRLSEHRAAPHRPTRNARRSSWT